LYLQLYYHFSVLRYERPCVSPSCSDGAIAADAPLSPRFPERPGPDGNSAYVHLEFGYNSIVNLWGVRTGTAVGSWIEVANGVLGSDFDTVKGFARFMHGKRFFLEHNLVVSAAVGAGVDLPFDFEFEGGGQSLRGYPFRQFRGDTLAEAHAEYIAPLIKVWK